MIMDHKHIEESVNAWAKGERSPLFNKAAATASETPRRVDMTAANDTKPGILGFNR